MLVVPAKGAGLQCVVENRALTAGTAGTAAVLSDLAMVDGEVRTQVAVPVLQRAHGALRPGGQELPPVLPLGARTLRVQNHAHPQ